MAKLSRRAVPSSSSSSSSSSASNSSASSTGSTPNSSTSTSSTALPSSSSSSTSSNGIPAASHSSNTVAYAGRPSKYVAPAIAFNDHQRGKIAATTETNNTKHFTAQPTLIDGVDAASPAPPHFQNKTIEAQILAAERDRVRAEFFATYDVMTGVRIAATLSGFFGLMVFLIVWKSRSSSNETMKVLKDPKMAAVAAVCMQEEEERELHEAIVATGMSIYPDEYDAIAYRRQRMLSLGNVSAPPMLNRGYRFSSVGGGGYSSLLEPPRRFSLSAASAAGSSVGSGRRKSGSESSRVLSNFPMGSSFGNDDYFMETDDELDNGEYAAQERTTEVTMHKRSDSTKSKHGFLEVPGAGHDSRRSSAMTCCSTDSSYLERRCSAFTLGLSNLPPSLQRKLSTASRTSSTDNWDYYYPDIQVIQPTPKQSPCPSERSIYEQLHPVASTTSSSSTAKPNKATTKNATKATSKTAKPNSAANVKKSVPSSSGTSFPSFVRKHSIAYYDPESAQAGRKQQIHSISADTVDVYPYNQTAVHDNGTGFFGDGAKPIQSAPPVSVHPGFHFTESPMEELFLNVRRKIAVVELQRPLPPTQIQEVATIHHPPVGSPGAIAYENNNNYPYTPNSAVAAPVAVGVKTTTAAAAAGQNAANSSSISIDSTPLSIDKLNGSSSLGTISAKALFNVEKRAPLASLSSFKISSLEYADSEARSLDDDSVFLDSVADTDEDMQQLSSGSEEASLEQAAATTNNCPTQNGTSKQIILNSAELDPEASTSKMAAMRLNQTSKHPIEKRYSLGANSTNRLRRPLLQRHRTISVSLSDRASLLSGHQMKEFPGRPDQTCVAGGGTQSPGVARKTPPLETHFGTVICTSSPPTHPRRAQLLQQYSDPQSQPTNTTTEEDTCSTLNTEVFGIGVDGNYAAGGGGGSGFLGPITTDETESWQTPSRMSAGGDGGSTTQTQHSSLNTVISFGRSSPLTDNNNVISCHSSIANAAAPIEPEYATSTGPQTIQQHQKQQQLPRSRLADDPCASSVSDSVISSRYPLISMPSSLKNLILRGSTTSQSQSTSTTATEKIEPRPSIAIVSRSAINLSALDMPGNAAHSFENILGIRTGRQSPCQVTLELPLIKIPTDESSESSTSSEADRERSRSKSGDETRDPSLPGSSRKWSKETLF